MNLKRQLAFAVAESISLTTPGFHWQPRPRRSGRRTLLVMAVLVLLAVFGLAAFAGAMR